MDAPETAEDQLRREASGLGVDDILALCYALQQRRQHGRLRLYMDVLRKRGGERAQFASALICFDLARQGDTAAQRDFAFLADTMRALASKDDLVTQLLEGDPYLVHIWELCRAYLDEMDLRFVEAAEIPAEAIEPVARLELISDVDFKDEIPDLNVDDGAMRQRFEEALESFLGGVPGFPVFDAESGFRLRASRDVERIEAFLHDLDSLKDFVRVARGYRALTLLFYGTHMRSRSIFGVLNARKQDILRAGILEFVASGHILAEIAGVLTPLHADASVWMKVSDVIQDYLRFASRHPDGAQGGVAGYDAVGRLIQREQERDRARR